jgi:hypothetical protein
VKLILAEYYTCDVSNLRVNAPGGDVQRSRKSGSWVDFIEQCSAPWATLGNSHRQNKLSRLKAGEYLRTGRF